MLLQRIKIIFVLFSAFLAVALPVTLGQEKPDYSHFTHKTHTGKVKVPDTKQERELKCDSCHVRQAARASAPARVATTKRNEDLQVKFPGHQACVECHIRQFTSPSFESCTICHSREQGLNQQPPQRDFPARKDYNALFDAKQHVDHVNKYPLANGQKQDCNYCHKPTTKQAALTIPSHSVCYTCHAPESSDAKAKLKAGCSVCHTQVVEKVEPFVTKLTNRAYGALFSHKTHVGYVGGSCNACHTIEGGYNQPDAAPTKIQVKQHFNRDQKQSGRGCFSCHDGGTHYGRQVFSGNGDCKKCHQTEDKEGRPRVIPTGG